MVLTRRQAILAVLATPLAQVPDKGLPGTLLIDLRRWRAVVVIKNDFESVELSADDIFSALSLPPRQAWVPEHPPQHPETTYRRYLPGNQYGYPPNWEPDGPLISI